jgi:hypothetical protein
MSMIGYTGYICNLMIVDIKNIIEPDSYNPSEEA